MSSSAQKPTGHASLIGATLGGYEVAGLVGRGAMGTVYLARDVALNRWVALKVLLGNLARNPALVKSLHREAQAAAPLRHPGIVRIFSAGIEDGTPYVAMEYVEGEPLDRFLRREGRLNWQTAFHIGGQVADALECAHRYGIVHRDIKPANILLDREGRVRLADFGIANIQADESAVPESGEFVGTPDYMSPEQCARRDVGPASDLFSLGVTLYQMISGNLPFQGDSTVALIRSITSEDPPRLNRIMGDVPDDVARLVAYLLQKQPEDRPPNALAVSQTMARLRAEQGGQSAMPAALEAFIREQSEVRTVNVVASPSRRSKRRPRKDSRLQRMAKVVPWPRRTMIAAFIVAVLLLCGVVTFTQSSFRRAPAKMAQAPLLKSLVFEPTASGVLLARLPAKGFLFSDVNWVGDKPRTLVCVEGRPGTLIHGSQGLIAVDPESHTAFSVQPPVGPAMDSEFWRFGSRVAGGYLIPPAPSASPLQDAVLLQVCRGQGREGRAQEVVLLAQKWNEAVPRPVILHKTTRHPWAALADSLWPEPTAGHALSSPDGFTICLVLYDPIEDANYLAERDMRWKPHTRVGPPLTTPRGTIIPESVQYAPDGKRIAYIRDISAVRRELWVVASGGGEVDGWLIEAADLGDRCAFSPSGGTIAAMVNRKGGVPEIRLYAVGPDRRIARAGPGFISKGAWHPSGGFLVVAAPEGTGRRKTPQSQEQTRNQMWAVEARAPYRRVQLTRFEEGVQGGCSISRDGRWAVAVLDETREPTVAFVEVGSVTFAVGS